MITLDLYKTENYVCVWIEQHMNSFGEQELELYVETLDGRTTLLATECNQESTWIELDRDALIDSFDVNSFWEVIQLKQHIINYKD